MAIAAVIMNSARMRHLWSAKRKRWFAVAYFLVMAAVCVAIATNILTSSDHGGAATSADATKGGITFYVFAAVMLGLAVAALLTKRDESR